MLKAMSKLLIQTLLGLLLWLLPDPELLQAKKPGKWYQFVHQKKDRMQARWNGKHPVSYTHLTLPTIYSV